MAEEINYTELTTVVFYYRREAQKNEEIVLYDEVKVPQKEAADDQKATNKHRHYQLMACCLGIVCVILLFSIIAVSVYFTSVISENNNKLTAENQQLETNLTKKYNDSKIKIKELTAENQQLKTQNQELKTQNQELKTLNILREQIRKIENCVTQQIFDAYCPIKDGNRQCKHCLKGWMHHQSSCYVIYNPDTYADQKTWEEALKDCRAKNSDLAVIVNEDEKTFISDNSWKKKGLAGYWIGLKAEAEKWKWFNGSDLAEKSWITQPANNSYCAMSVHNAGWKSVWCGYKNGWICKKAALSV